MIRAAWRPVFATPHPLLIAGVREILSAAGIDGDPQVVAPEALDRALSHADHWLVILDGGALPPRAALAHLCRSHPESLFVLWVPRPTAEILNVALECGVHGLLSTKLTLEEASAALTRISEGERMFRFDVDSGPAALAKPVELTARERHLLLILSQGASNAAIAATLHTTQSSVKVCLSRMFRKTGARNRRELVELSRSLALSTTSGNPSDESFDERWMLENL